MEAPIPAAASGEVKLEIPSLPAFVRVARLVASGIGTFAGMDIDEIDDLRIAVDELCAIAIDGAAGGALSLVFLAGEDSVTVSGQVGSCWDDGRVPQSERWLISEQILDVVVDQRDVHVADGVLSFSMVKQRRDV